MRLVIPEALAQNVICEVMSAFGKSDGAIIHYSDFLVRVMTLTIVRSNHLLIKAFRFLKRSQSGSISLAEQVRALQLSHTSSEIAEAEQVSLGKLDWEHFREWMQHTQCLELD